MIPFNFSFSKFAAVLLSGRRKQQQQLDRIEKQQTILMDALADLQAAAAASNAKLESIADNVIQLRAQVTSLQQSTVDPAAVEAIVANMSSTLADVETKLGTPTTPTTPTTS